MSTKIRYYFLMVLVVLFPHCSKRVEVRHDKLGIDYYKMSVLELEERGVGDSSCKKSLYYINRALEQEIKPRYLAHKATLLFLIGDQEASEAVFESVLAMQIAVTLRTEILNNYACMLARGGRKKEASQLFLNLEGDANYVTPEVSMVNQAKLYCDEGDWESAHDKLVHATTLAPDYVDAFYYLGLVCYALRSYGVSSQAIERVIALEPDHPGANELLYRLKRRGNT